MMQPGASPSRYNRSPAQTLQAITIPEALLKVETVSALTGLSGRTIYRRVAEKRFPLPVKDGLRCTRWVAADVSNWLRAKAAA
jgi:prophage regulatory protein